MGECVLPMAAINYKALGLHVLIRSINVSSFPSHIPPFASINAEGERRSVRASEKGERERETVSCFIWRRWVQAGWWKARWKKAGQAAITVNKARFVQFCQAKKKVQDLSFLFLFSASPTNCKYIFESWNRMMQTRSCVLQIWPEA